MQRNITGFHLDEEQDWVAKLDCYHNQHVRHKPPFINRPWVASESGRIAKLGTALDCVRCDRLELPQGLNAYKRTPEFTETTIPKGLLKDHSTKTGTWGILHVTNGELIYTVNYPAIKEFRLSQDTQGIIAPCMQHSVKPAGKVTFYVEFYSAG